MEKEIEQLNTTLKRVIKNEVRRLMIAEAAYYRAEKRGFKNGDTMEDWLNAEGAVDQKLMNAFLSYLRPPSIGTAEAAEKIQSNELERTNKASLSNGRDHTGQKTLMMFGTGIIAGLLLGNGRNVRNMASVLSVVSRIYSKMFADPR